MFSHPSQYTQQGVSSTTARPARTLIAGDAGFSLIELLVVILVIGILAGIAIPSFVSQQSKATDAQAKELARTAETTAESIATGHDGSYATVSETSLHEEEPAIPIGAAANPHKTYLSFAKGTPSEYTVTAKAPDGDELIIRRSAEGLISRECKSPESKTGCDGGEVSSW